MASPEVVLDLYRWDQALLTETILSARSRMQAGSEYDAGSGELSRLANQLLATGKTTGALELARKLAEDSPKSAAAAVLLARAIEPSDTPRNFPIYTDAIREISTLEPKAVK